MTRRITDRSTNRRRVVARQFDDLISVALYLSKRTVPSSPIDVSPCVGLTMEGRNHHSPLLDLPPELRNRIYFYLLPRPSYYGIGAAAPLNTIRDVQALSKVNKQLRNEILPVCFGNTEFLVKLDNKKDRDSCLRWLGHMDCRKSSMIHDLSLHIGTVEVHFTTHRNLNTSLKRPAVQVWSPWRSRCLSRSREKRINEVLDSIRPASGSTLDDSGLRAFHIAKLLVLMCHRRAFSATSFELLGFLSCSQRQGKDAQSPFPRFWSWLVNTEPTT